MDTKKMSSGKTLCKHGSEPFDCRFCREESGKAFGEISEEEMALHGIASLLISQENTELKSIITNKDKELAKLRAALEDAVQAVNTMQTLLMQSGLVTNSGAVSANIKLAFNRGAKFLSDNSEMQTEYLKKRL